MSTEQKKIVVLLGNPKTKSFCRSLAEAYCEGAEASGANVQMIDLRKLRFDPILWEGYDVAQPLEADLEKAQELILWADHLVVVFPVWWGGLPALLKGFFDRCFLPGFAFDFEPETAWWKKHLTGRSAHVISSLASPYLIYRTLFRKSAHRALVDSTLKFCGFSPVRTTTFASIEDTSSDEIQTYIDEVRKKGREFY